MGGKSGKRDPLTQKSASKVSSEGGGRSRLDEAQGNATVW